MKKPKKTAEKGWEQQSVQRPRVRYSATVYRQAVKKTQMLLEGFNDSDRREI